MARKPRVPSRLIRTAADERSTAATEELADEVATAVHALVTGADDEPWNALIMKIAAKTAKNDHGIAAVSLAQAVSELAHVKRGLEARLAALEQRPELK